MKSADSKSRLLSLRLAWRLAGALPAGLVLLAGLAAPAYAFGAPGSSTNPQSGSVGLQGTVSTPPPSRPASIAMPSSGQVFTATPITVNGLCPNSLLVKLFSNNIFVGSAQCVNGSYNLQIDLFSGTNDLVARVYDALDQAGPDSNTVQVTFHDTQLGSFGLNRVSLSSIYARRGADPGSQLDWPVILSGGTGPYAISVNWGDGQPDNLVSQPFAGTVLLHHIYSAAGTYRVVVKATDKDGASAYLQLVGVANGAAAGGISTNKNSANITVTQTKILWWPAAASLPLILIAFWLGRRHELFALRQHIEQSTRNETARY